jgi:hypothetical protein
MAHPFLGALVERHYTTCGGLAEMSRTTVYWRLGLLRAQRPSGDTDRSLAWVSRPRTGSQVPHRRRLDASSDTWLHTAGAAVPAERPAAVRTPARLPHNHVTTYLLGYLGLLTSSQSA